MGQRGSLIVRASRAIGAGRLIKLLLPPPTIISTKESIMKKIIISLVAIVLAAGGLSAKGASILNVSYDPTRELYAGPKPVKAK